MLDDEARVPTGLLHERFVATPLTATTAGDGRCLVRKATDHPGHSSDFDPVSGATIYGCAKSRLTMTAGVEPTPAALGCRPQPLSRRFFPPSNGCVALGRQPAPGSAALTVVR